MEPSQIGALLQRFGLEVSPQQLGEIHAYLELLLRWNSRLNLTAVRDAEHIVTRHIGESLFAASRLLAPGDRLAVLDVGSGAGFPGLPIKIYAPGTRLTLIESQNKKATFLGEAIRTLGWCDAQVFAGRAEAYVGTADLVTLRAVEKFATILPVAAARVSPGGTLGLLIGESQVALAKTLLREFVFSAPERVPGSAARVVLAAKRQGNQDSK